MTNTRVFLIGMSVAATVALGACSQGGQGRVLADPNAPSSVPVSPRASGSNGQGSTIWDIFKSKKNEQVVNVNKYIWQGALDVLNFLPVQSVDPFSGVIVTGYGTPPGGGRAYRATVYVSDAALEARSLNVALQSRRGPVSAATQRAVEDAILTRARQLRVAATKF